MKKYFAIALMLVLCITGCKKPDSIQLNTATWTAPYEGEAFTLTVTASGDYKGTPDVDWLTVSGATVTVAENTTYEARTGKVTFTCGSESAVVTVNQEAAPKPKEYKALDGPANSYIVSEGGDYKIQATVMGNGDKGLHSTFPITSTAISPASAKLLWEEAEGLITDVKLQDGYICFTVDNKDGNAVVAATDASDNILWSWHIWSAEAPKDINLGTWTMMDRNLGAYMTGTDPDSYGMYYQWGRKDPFSRVLGLDSGAGEGWYHPVVGGAGEDFNDMADATIHSIAYSVAHPNEFIACSNRNNDWLIEANQRYLWGINWEVDQNPDYQAFKSVYDPCPKGYAVASPTCFAAGVGSAVRNSDNSFTLFDGKITVPAAGFIYTGGNGWYDADGNGWAGLWTCSTAWGNVENAFRMAGHNFDARDNYDRATGHPVRCYKFSE